MKNTEIAGIFFEMADILEMKNVQWKPRAYRQAARAVSSLPEDVEKIYKKGGTMRLGTYPCVLEPGTIAHKIYNKEGIFERHRHRYEVNPKYVEFLESKGLKFSGKSPDGNLMEIIELPGHPYFIACQFHPEYQSRLENPAPLFTGLVHAAFKRKFGK